MRPAIIRSRDERKEYEALSSPWGHRYFEACVDDLFPNKKKETWLGAEVEDLKI